MYGQRDARKQLGKGKGKGKERTSGRLSGDILVLASVVKVLAYMISLINSSGVIKIYYKGKDYPA